LLREELEDNERYVVLGRAWTTERRQILVEGGGYLRGGAVVVPANHVAEAFLAVLLLVGVDHLRDAVGPYDQHAASAALASGKRFRIQSCEDVPGCTAGNETP
jgi:hypothetical protein